MDFSVPDDTQRIAIVGRTGSGKTQAGVWLLSLRSYDVMPWVIYDYKRDSLISRIPAKELQLNETPNEPGVYVVHPLPDSQAEVEAHMWLLWNRGNVGVFVDEGFMVGNGNGAFDALLTQGRSKGIPMIVLSQRPVWLTRFVFSEADFYMVFFMNDERDRKTLQSFIPDEDGDLLGANRLPEYHSYYYDVANDDLLVLKPVPDADSIIQVFESRLTPIMEAEVVKVPRLRFI